MAPARLAFRTESTRTGGSGELDLNTMIRIESAFYGTHSMRRTKAAQIYRKTSNLRAVQLLLCHTKLESTVRYLGIEVDDALNIAEQIEL
jgi:site-specific recombinase XerC